MGQLRRHAARARPLLIVRDRNPERRPASRRFFFALIARVTPVSGAKRNAAPRSLYSAASGRQPTTATMSRKPTT